MKKIASSILTTLMVCMLCCGCKKKTEDQPKEAFDKPVLVFPRQDEVCTTGQVISLTQSTVSFGWNMVPKAESYTLYWKDLLQGTTNEKNVSVNQTTISLGRGIPYSWWVVAKTNAGAETAQSEIWKFYNSGPGLQSYAPFPADAIAPIYGQVFVQNTKLVNLSWKGADVDDTDLKYDLYFGTTTSPAMLRSGIKETTVADIPTPVNGAYYWRVVTKDNAGNSSTSTLFYFKIGIY
ncbi:hypothetical protein J7E50_23625 [Pedobacter sp. ISL-68]|uniref:hypothetical protein n=1 Tax=unclassified Pedobacter TaxID=2628915 RepID=UPI001BEA9A5C|nr:MULTISPECIES: hypothetical protein [unclassified Pedobacter]MBT2560497.1 hypothetical protein [Pedobacter sp. ISL-64]MBT2593230.1 hypothetical protein [Pedobacter sp. ISL-68]